MNTTTAPMTTSLRRLGAALGVALLTTIAACSSNPPSQREFEAARSTLQEARGHPFAASAAVEIERAQLSLARAEDFWNKGSNAEMARQQTYVAWRQAEIALAVARQAENENRVAQAARERDRIVLAARTQEAEAAQARARSAQADAERARQAAAEESQRVAALQRSLSELRAQPTDRGLVVTLGDVLFATGRATLQPGARRSVQRIAEVLKQNPERRVLIEGFTDSTGGEETNLELSQRRAEAFAQALVANGVEAPRIEVRAHGEAYPVADNDSAAGRQRNRRVEVLFSDAQGRLVER